MSLCHHRFLKGREQLLTIGWDRKHTKCIFKRSVMTCDTGGRAAVFQSVDFVPMLICSSHRRLNAAICKETTKDQILDVVLTKQEVKVGRMESAKTNLSLDNQIFFGRGHHRADFRTPLTCQKCFAFLDTSQNSVGSRGNLLVTL